MKLEIENKETNIFQKYYCELKPNEKEILLRYLRNLREIKNRFRLFTRSLARQGIGGSFKNSKKTLRQ